MFAYLPQNEKSHEVNGHYVIAVTTPRFIQSKIILTFFLKLLNSLRLRFKCILECIAVVLQGVEEVGDDVVVEDATSPPEDLA